MQSDNGGIRYTGPKKKMLHVIGDRMIDRNVEIYVFIWQQYSTAILQSYVLKSTTANKKRKIYR